MYCPKCGAVNEEDAIFCKHCGFPLEENENLISKEESKTKENIEKEKPKTKTKHKNKNKTKHKNKTKVKKEKPQKIYNQKSEKGMTFGQKFLMFILFLMVFSLIGILLAGGYYYYKSLDIEVPNVVNMTYEEAAIVLTQKDLKVKKIEKTVTNPDEAGIVLEQSKKAGKKVRKNTTIKLTVGVYEKTYTMENFEGQDVTTAINTLENNNISYDITYTETDEYENNIIISQDPKAGEILKENDKVTLEVAKNKESAETDEDKESQEETITSENDQNNKENNEDNEINTEKEAQNP